GRGAQRRPVANGARGLRRPRPGPARGVPPGLRGVGLRLVHGRAPAPAGARAGARRAPPLAPCDLRLKRLAPGEERSSSPGREVGVPTFEPGTSPTRTERATRLRHTPKPRHRVAGMSEPLAAAVARDWGLRLGEPYPPGAAGYVVQVELAEGTPAVLKLQHSHRED